MAITGHSFVQWYLGTAAVINIFRWKNRRVGGRVRLLWTSFGENYWWFWMAS
jgi:hypothetical protein